MNPVYTIAVLAFIVGAFAFLEAGMGYAGGACIGAVVVCVVDMLSSHD